LAEVTVKEFEKALPRGIEAMQELHDILTRGQREKLVALFTEGRKLSDEERREARNNKITRVLGLTTGQKATIYPALFTLYIKHWGTIGRFRAALHEAEDAFLEDTFVAKDLKIASELELMALGEVIFDALEIGLNHLTREQHATLAALLDSQLRSPNPTRADENSAAAPEAVRTQEPLQVSAPAEEAPPEAPGETETGTGPRSMDEGRADERAALGDPSEQDLSGDEAPEEHPSEHSP
jgi:hypothetical protein